MRGLQRVAIGALAVLATGSLAQAGTASCIADARANFLSCRHACRSDFIDTRFACRNVQPACGEACLAGRQQCLDDADAILKTGQLPGGGTLASCTGGTDACKATLQAAKQTCGAPCQVGDAQCDACVDAAQTVAFQCRDTCRESWRTDTTVVAVVASCRTSFRGCVTACPRAS